MEFIKRHVAKTLTKLARAFPAVLVTGARQVGKTTLLKETNQGVNVLAYTSFDDPMEERFAKTDPKGFMDLHPAPHMFDEVQYVPELFRYLKIAIDNSRKNGSYFLTGSQQFSLLEKSSESLSGRIGIVQLYGLSMREIRNDDFSLNFMPTQSYITERNNGLQTATFSTKKTWERIFQGGYPEVVKGTVSPREFYANYLKTYIERDIRSLTQVGDESQFLTFIAVVASRTSQVVNYADIARDCGISEVTAKKWLSLLVTSGLIFLLKPYSVNVAKRIVKTPKLYFMDTGLAAYLTRWTNPDVLQQGAMSGAFFETFVVSEIIKSFANNGEEAPIYYYRDKDKIEIDLLIEENNTLYPIEIKKTASPNSDDAKNFFITNRINNVTIAQPTIICNCDKVSVVSNRDTRAMVIPLEFV